MAASHCIQIFTSMAASHQKDCPVISYDTPPVRLIVKHQPRCALPSRRTFLSRRSVNSIETDTKRAIKIIKNIHNYWIFAYEFHIYENSIKHSGAFSLPAVET
jgi:hypothetical protein